MNKGRFLVQVLVVLISVLALFSTCHKDIATEPDPIDTTAVVVPIETDTFATSIFQPELTVFEAPQGAKGNPTFAVRVRYEGGEWISLYEYDAQYGKNGDGHMAFVSFESDFTKKIEVQVEKKSGSIASAQIRPEIAGVVPIVDNKTITFSLTSPRKLSVELNGNIFYNLMVFANKLDSSVIDKKSPLYFGPGIHKIGGDGKGTLVLHSNDRLYIDGGAILYGKISANHVNNISIAGRGILNGELFTDHSTYTIGENLINISNSTDVHISGITLLNTVSWNVTFSSCDSVVCDNLKIISYGTTSDGIDPVSSSKVYINDCFIRNYDDCISIKLAYGIGGSSNTRGCHTVMIRNCIFWPDMGRAILIGPESYSTLDRIYDNITVKDIDVLYCKNYDATWAKGVLAINLGDGATVKDVTFEDIRVDEIAVGTNLIGLSILKSPFNISPGQSIQNISFNRVSLNSGLTNLNNYIQGYDESKYVNGIHFIDLKINEQYIKDATTGRFDINPFAYNITFDTTN